MLRDLLSYRYTYVLYFFKIVSGLPVFFVECRTARNCCHCRAALPRSSPHPLWTHPAALPHSFLGNRKQISPLRRIFPLFQFSCHVRKSFLRVCARVRVCVFIFRHIAAIECKQKSNNDAAWTWAGGEGSRLRMGGRGRGFWRESKRTQQFDAIKTKWAQGEWDSSVRPTVGIAYLRGVRRGVEKTPKCLITFFQHFFDWKRNNFYF